MSSGGDSNASVSPENSVTHFHFRFWVPSVGLLGTKPPARLVAQLRLHQWHHNGECTATLSGDRCPEASLRMLSRPSSKTTPCFLKRASTFSAPLKLLQILEESTPPIVQPLRESQNHKHTPTKRGGATSALLSPPPPSLKRRRHQHHHCVAAASSVAKHHSPPTGATAHSVRMHTTCARSLRCHVFLLTGTEKIEVEEKKQ